MIRLSGKREMKANMTPISRPTDEGAWKSGGSARYASGGREPPFGLDISSGFDGAGSRVLGAGVVERFAVRVWECGIKFRMFS